MKKGKTMLESAHDLALAFNGLGESIEKAVIPVVKKLSDALNKVKKKKMKLYTIAEIAEILNLNIRTVTYRFDRLSIKGEWLNRRYYFTEEQVSQINVRKNKIPNIPLYSDRSFYEKQIQIIEMWKC